MVARHAISISCDHCASDLGNGLLMSNCKSVAPFDVCLACFAYQGPECIAAEKKSDLRLISVSERSAVRDAEVADAPVCTDDAPDDSAKRQRVSQAAEQAPASLLGQRVSLIFLETMQVSGFSNVRFGDFPVTLKKNAWSVGKCVADDDEEFIVSYRSAPGVACDCDIHISKEQRKSIIIGAVNHTKPLCFPESPKAFWPA
jgi:hypothetical protein